MIDTTALKRTGLLIAKILVSLLLLVYLIRNTDMDALEDRLRGAHALVLAGGVVLYALMLMVSTWRWRVLLHAQGHQAPLARLSASYLVATFFNNFLPSNIGGDFIRVRDSTRLTGCTTTAVAIIAIDRILGFGALYLLAVVAFALGGPLLRQLAGARVVLGSLALLFGAFAYAFFRPGTARRLMAKTGLSERPWAQQRFETVQAAVHVYREELRAIWTAFALSVTLQTLVVFYYFAVAKALDIGISLSACFLMVPLCTLVQAVPVSFNGWGVRESLFIVYFHQVGLPRDSALAFSLVGAGLIVLLSLSGAVVWTSRGGSAESAANP